MIALVVCAILVWVGLEDMRHFRVRNVAVVVLDLCFPLNCLLLGRPAFLAPHLMLAGVTFCVMVGAFLIGGVGGGDAKLLTAAMLWVGPEGAVLFAVLLLAATSLYIAGAWLGWLARRRSGRRTAIPFAPSIAVAWITTIGLQALASV